MYQYSFLLVCIASITKNILQVSPAIKILEDFGQRLEEINKRDIIAM